MSSVRIFFYNAKVHASFDDAMTKFNAGDKTAITHNGSYIEADGALSNIQDIGEVVDALNDMHTIASGSSPTVEIVTMVVDSEGNALTLDDYVERNECW